MRHLILTDNEVEELNRLIEKEKDSVAHLMAVNVLGTNDEKAARTHFHAMHRLQHSLKDES